MLVMAGQKTGGQALLGGLDCTVHRNYFGSQVWRPDGGVREGIFTNSVVAAEQF